MKNEMDNPPDMVFVAIAVSCGIVFISVAFLVRETIVFTLSLLTGIGVLAISILSQFMLRPIHLEVADSGLTLKYRSGKMRFVPLTSI